MLITYLCLPRVESKPHKILVPLYLGFNKIQLTLLQHKLTGIFLMRQRENPPAKAGGFLCLISLDLVQYASMTTTTEIRISLSDYERFIFKFYNLRAYGPQRLGQAFCNSFDVGDARLFYELDSRESLDLIDSFISCDEPTHRFTEPRNFVPNKPR